MVDVANAAAPVEIARAFDMNYAYDVALAGRYAYIGAGGAGLLIADVSNPVLPVELGTYDTPGNARGVAVADSRAYVADERYGLQIVTVADSQHPALLGNLKTEGWAFDVAVAGNRVYVAAAFGGLRVVNVSDPAHPLEVGSLSWAQSHAASGAGEWLCLPRRPQERPAGDQHRRPRRFRRRWAIGMCAALAPRFRLAGIRHVAAGFNGVRVFDISNPAQPVRSARTNRWRTLAYPEVVGTRLVTQPPWGR